MDGGKKRRCSTKVGIMLVVVSMLFSLSAVPSFSGDKITENVTSGFPSGWSDDFNLTKGSDYNTDPSISISGNHVHLFYQNGSNGELYYAHSADAGRSWDKNGIFTPDDIPSSLFPKVTTNGSDVYVVWQDSRLQWPRKEIFYQHSGDNGENWDTEFNLSLDDDENSQNPSIACSGQNVHIVWEDGRDDAVGLFEIYYKRSTDGGNTWDDGLGNIDLDRRLTTNLGWNDVNSYIDIDGDTIHVIWTKRTSSFDKWETMYIRSLDNGATWDSPVMLSEEDAWHSMGQSMSVGDSGDVHVLWTEYKYGTEDVVYRNSIDNGATWNPEIRLNANANESEQPDIAVNASHVFVTWMDDRDHYDWTGSTSGAFELYYIESFDGGGSWGPETRLTYAVNNSIQPCVAMDADNIHIAWTDNRTNGSREQIFYKRYPDFPTDTTPPTITHTQITEAPINQPIDIVVNVTDNVEVGNVTLYYQNVGDTEYAPIDMIRISGNNQSGDWNATIPAQAKTGLVHYFIWANDTSGNNITSPIMGDYAIQITGPPSIDIISPEGGEEWTGGSNHLIEFIASDTEDAPAVLDVFLNYTYNTGTITGTIVQTTGDGSPYDWTLPIINATDVKINATIVDTDGNKTYDESLIFTINSSPPEIISTNPVNNTTGISIFQPVVIQFNEKMNISSVIVNQTNGTDPGGWSWFWNEDKDTITGIHDAWSRGENVEITVHAGYKDVSDPGNANNTAYIFSFTTEINPSPEIIHTNISSPQELGDTIKINATITDDGDVMNAVLWWQDVDSVWHENYMDKNGNDWEYVIPGQMTVGKVKYQINATDDLQQKNTTIIYEFDIEDTTPPVIVHTPVESAVVGELVNITCQVTDLGGVNETAVYLFYKTIESKSSYTQVTMNSGFWYEVSTNSFEEYYIQAFDIYGNYAVNGVHSVYLRDFTPLDIIHPIILFVTPTGDDISISTSISIVFREDMNKTSVENAISISPDISFSSSWTNDQTLILSIVGNLSYNTTYSVAINTGAKDLAGNTLGNDYTWQFTTAEEPEIVQQPASNDVGWIGIVIFLVSAIALLMITILYNRKEQE